MLLKFMALLVSIVPMVSAQDRGVLHQGITGDSQSVIITARTTAFLSCESGDIVVKVNFTQPFRGLMYAHRSRSSPCRVHGTGSHYYQLRIPLKGCGTWQESPRVFINNVTIRFHPALELEEDETKTVVCRYPPPLTQPPGSVHVLEPPTSGPNPVPTRVGTARLSEVEILIIICLLLFLSLLTLGIGIAYFCLKRRNIHIVRKSAVSSAPASQITRLSSSNIPPPPSLLSSVLGHTVRIPRAVPYSAPIGRASMVSSPDHHYEEYPASSSTSGELSETSVSISSEDQVDATKQLLYKKAGAKTLLSIPKAILRKSGTKRWREEPTVHNYLSKINNTASVGTSARQQEMEDQTVITVMEPDDSSSTENGIVTHRKQIAAQLTDTQTSGLPKKAAPVYAKVDKSKKIITRNQKYNIENLEMRETKPPPRMPVRPSPAPAVFRRQRTVITDIPEESSTSEEVVKNTTVTTSVRREVTETKVISPNLKKEKNLGESVDGSSGLSTTETDPHLSRTEASSTQIAEQDTAPQPHPKSILIRDVADIYLTTTVETESRELKTHVSRDVLEARAKTKSSSPISSIEGSKAAESKIPTSADNWNVIIRQRKAPPNWGADGDDIDRSRETTNNIINKPKQDVTPIFDVKIRTIPPNDLKKNETPTMMPIPPLEMPQTIGKIKALMPKTTQEGEPHAIDFPKKGLPANKAKPSTSHRTVHWRDLNKDIESTVSSSDSFHSAESLRERSSSEVLEVAPTLPSQQRRGSDHPMLERSTSEIVTSPEDHVRWIGGVVPVLESLSPEFLANIPVVIQGGFFNKQHTTSPEAKK